MKQFCIIAVSCLTIARLCRAGHTVDLSIPENLIFGAATASYQVEGAWNVSDKGESVCDWWAHNKPQYTADGANGDVACDSYHHYKEDVRWIKKLGLDYYRFSISWSRVLPSGFATKVSKDGIGYYKNLIKELKANNITPVVTIYHWDHPQILEECGGWTNDLMVKWFSDYARVIFRELGPMVKMFLTVNEPNIRCNFGYNGTRLAPGKTLSNKGQYLCVHNMLKAHAAAYHIYDKEFRSKQHGKVGLTTACKSWVTTNDTDAALIDQFFQFDCGWVMHPIYKGDYPEIMKTRIAKISKLEGYRSSRLPEFSKEMISYVKGTADFFGVNHYTSSILNADPAEKHGVYTVDSGIINTIDKSWKLNGAWVYDLPKGFGNVLRMIKSQYGNPPVYIFENGASSKTGTPDDYDRIHYFHGYLSEMLSAIKNDGCNILGYTIWSLLDNFQWWLGYKDLFGIVSVNFTDPNRARSPKLSAKWWQKLLKNRIIPDVPVKKSKGGKKMH